MENTTIWGDRGAVVVGAEGYLSADLPSFLNIRVIEKIDQKNFKARLELTLEGARATSSMALSTSRTFRSPDFPDKFDGVDEVVDILFSKPRVTENKQESLLTGGFFNFVPKKLRQRWDFLSLNEVKS